MIFQNLKSWIASLSKDGRRVSEDRRQDTEKILTKKTFNHLSNNKTQELPFG